MSPHALEWQFNICLTKVSFCELWDPAPLEVHNYEAKGAFYTKYQAELNVLKQKFEGKKNSQNLTLDQKF